MPKFLKSDLTYSLSGGFILGALVLFFMQPVQDQQAFSQTLTATMSAAGQLLG